ncbi:MAG: EAL domain-containing protein [Myxococcales bacterium]|nr:EAL domain-containing protein [Myxococcales bacterium]
MPEAVPLDFTEWLDRQDAPRHSSRATRPSDIPGVLRSGELKVVYQPLIDLSSGEIFAYECLVRSTAPEHSSPPALFTAAIEAGVCGALGRRIRELAIQNCPHAPLFINIHPHEFDEGWLVQPDDPIFEHEHAVYIEITESVPLTHFELCSNVLTEVRHKGIMLAVDDLGAGYSNLRYIADLSPEIVKLDRSLTHKISKDVRLQRLVRAITSLCIDLSARVVAEGLEHPEDVHAVKDCGAHYGQGYIFARPAFPPPAYTRKDYQAAGLTR